MFSEFYGNSHLTQPIENAVKDGKLSHAYIIEGDRGSGKRTFARLVCALLAGGKDDPLAMKILSGTSPDVTEYDVPEKKKFITVDTVRGIKYDANIKPNELDIRVFIINHADAMNTQAQNALLKLLEEPPPGVYFFLTLENSQALLPTVRSRAQCLRMERFTEEKVRDYLIKYRGYSPAEAASAAAVSSGSIGAALEYKGNGKTDNDRENINALLDAVKKKNFPEIILAVNVLPSDRTQLEAALVCMEKALRDMAAAKSGNFGMMYYESTSRALTACGSLGINNIISLSDCVYKAHRDVNLNMNVQNIKICLAKRMMRAVSV